MVIGYGIMIRFQVRVRWLLGGRGHGEGYGGGYVRSLTFFKTFSSTHLTLFFFSVSQLTKVFLTTIVQPAVCTNRSGRGSYGLDLQLSLITSGSDSQQRRIHHSAQPSLSSPFSDHTRPTICLFSIECTLVFINRHSSVIKYPTVSRMHNNWLLSIHP